MSLYLHLITVPLKFLTAGSDGYLKHQSAAEGPSAAAVRQVPTTFPFGGTDGLSPSAVCGRRGPQVFFFSVVAWSKSKAMQIIFDHGEW